MAERICASEGCGTLVGPKGARGWCPMHYRAWYYAQPPKPRPPCSAPGCSKPTVQRLWCAMHRGRLKRTGSLDLIARERPTCSVDGCDAKATSRQLCSKHNARLDRHGNTDVMLAGPREQHFAWGGDEVTYRTAHGRLTRYRGKANQHPCVDCGALAAQWSYDGKAENEQRDPRTGIAYTTEMVHYQPRCYPCHKAFDLRSHCPHGHAYEGANVIFKKDGSRACRTCKRRMDRASYLKRRGRVTPALDRAY
jgi:hypothetical protein